MADKRGLVPKLRYSNETYFDAEAMLEWFKARYPGRRVGSRTIAKDLGVPRNTVRGFLRGGQPTLHTYCLMMAYARLPIGTWIRL